MKEDKERLPLQTVFLTYGLHFLFEGRKVEEHHILTGPGSLGVHGALR